MTISPTFTHIHKTLHCTVYNVYVMYTENKRHIVCKGNIFFWKTAELKARFVPLSSLYNVKKLCNKTVA